MTLKANYSTTGQKNLTYGDGSSGRLDVSGTSTTSSASYYRDVLVRAAGTHSFANAHVWCLGSYTLAGTSKATVGAAASGSTSGTGTSAGSLPGTTTPANGSATAATATTGTVGIGLTGDGGGGGLSGGTTQASGSHAQLVANWRGALWGGGVVSTQAQVCTSLFGNTSAGGRGSGDGSNAGGGAGSGGGHGLLAARFLVQISGGSLTYAGGNGAAGAGGTAGGGGGGGSGGMLMVATVYVNAAITPARTEGTGGAGQGGAGNGSGGVAGTSQRITNPT